MPKKTAAVKSTVVTPRVKATKSPTRSRKAAKKTAKKGTSPSKMAKSNVGVINQDLKAAVPPTGASSVITGAPGRV